MSKMILGPRHKGTIEPEICGNRCLVVDEVKVPHPDCNIHGGTLYTEPKTQKDRGKLLDVV